MHTPLSSYLTIIVGHNVMACIYIHLSVFEQRWAWAYHEENYHAAIDSNNGTVVQNKLFKYSFLPQKKYTATLSNTVSIIVESFLLTRRQNTCYKTTSSSQCIDHTKIIFHHFCTTGQGQWLFTAWTERQTVTRFYLSTYMILIS